MLRLGLVTLAVTATLGICGTAHATCSSDQENAAYTAVDNIRSWRDLAGFYHDHLNCDDGAIAEGVTDAVDRLVTRDWGRVSTIDEDLRGDAGLSRWIIRHVDELWSRDEFATARDNAAHHCPQGLDTFCQAIVVKIDAPY